MSLKSTLQWHDNSKKFAKDSHAIFGASNYHWVNYSEEKMLEVYTNSQAKRKGTELHEIACGLIKNGIILPNIPVTFNMYVNDSILYGMRPEEQLYYSKWFFGTADSIILDNGILRIHDLKTGKTKAHIEQLYIYAAYFCLEYGLVPNDFKDIELRIYQNNDILVGHPGNEEIVPIMDKVITMTSVLEKLEGVERYG